MSASPWKQSGWTQQCDLNKLPAWVYIYTEQSCNIFLTVQAVCWDPRFCSDDISIQNKCTVWFLAAPEATSIERSKPKRLQKFRGIATRTTRMEKDISYKVKLLNNRQYVVKNNGRKYQDISRCLCPEVTSLFVGVPIISNVTVYGDAP